MLAVRRGRIPTSISFLLVNRVFGPLGIFGVAEELSRASGKRVDVYEMSELDPGPFRETVLKEAVPL